jgi:hypothetical protein
MESFDGEVGARTSTLSQVQRALERAGVEFLNHERPGAHEGGEVNFGRWSADDGVCH